MTIEPGTNLSNDTLINVGWGLVYRWVCAPASWDAERVGAEATRTDPPGTTANRWEVTATNGELTTNPMPCNDCASRRHWCINC